MTQQHTWSDRLELADLDLDMSELTVTSLRDSVALPENGATTQNCSCMASSSCIPPTMGDPQPQAL
ncbi:thiazolylpeptide-type bacteriocin [Kitasatospora sp. NBC_01287]|uniref:thiazolylpeptide-type bacteriocin n=1 Tax=Kitasatospora sp. NBC_01287 TaxID=2903573 RepID=UPI00224C98AF|nr:thiazolylpeptide-type bacteriocin [Kitasatospora sp. NBC_01287]MCX4745871.1 thiazolylpeptide-type bacteriocin [Kitasatospora sp. NBC_01287]